jgi:sugar lactone lactonase YvrE
MTEFENAPEDVAWDCVVDAKSAHGEVPIWATEHDALFWVDLFGPALHKSSIVDGATRTWSVPNTFGSYGLRKDGRSAVIALSDGIYDLDLETERLNLWHAAPYDQEHFRFNDGRCDPRGRFWVGTVRLPSSDAPDGTGSFWCLDETGLTRRIDDITIANGIAFSPSGKTMYLADRPNWRILAFDYALATGIPTNRRTFTKLPTGWIPDGAAVDVDGGYWIAFFGVGRIARFKENGQLDRLLRAPTMHPTMVSFGGSDLRTMFVTTARSSLDADGLAADPLAGGVFAHVLDIAGLKEPRFGDWAPAV